MNFDSTRFEHSFFFAHTRLSVAQIVATHQLELNPALMETKLFGAAPRAISTASIDVPLMSMSPSTVSRDLFKLFPQSLQPPAARASPPPREDVDGTDGDADDAPAAPASAALAVPDSSVQSRRAAAVGLAADDMLQRIEKLEGNSRERLEDIANNKCARRSFINSS